MCFCTCSTLQIQSVQPHQWANRLSNFRINTGIAAADLGIVASAVGGVHCTPADDGVVGAQVGLGCCCNHDPGSGPTRHGGFPRDKASTVPSWEKKS